MPPTGRWTTAHVRLLGPVTVVELARRCDAKQPLAVELVHGRAGRLLPMHVRNDRRGRVVCAWSSPERGTRSQQSCGAVR